MLSPAMRSSSAVPDDPSAMPALRSCRPRHGRPAAHGAGSRAARRRSPRAAETRSVPALLWGGGSKPSELRGRARQRPRIGRGTGPAKFRRCRLRRADAAFERALTKAAASRSTRPLSKRSTLLDEVDRLERGRDHAVLRRSTSSHGLERDSETRPVRRPPHLLDDPRVDRRVLRENPPARSRRSSADSPRRRRSGRRFGSADEVLIDAVSR